MVAIGNMIDLDKERALIESTALKNGFKLKQQPNGEMALNPHVFDFAEELLANKQAEITELKQKLEKLKSGEFNSDIQAMNKDLSNGVITGENFDNLSDDRNSGERP